MSAGRIEQDVLRELDESGPALEPAERVRVSERIRALIAETPAPKTEQDRILVTHWITRTIKSELSGARAASDRATARTADRKAEAERVERRQKAEASAAEATARLLAASVPTPPNHYRLGGRHLPDTPPTDRREG